MRTYFVTITVLWSALLLHTIYRIPVWNSGMTDEDGVALYQSTQWHCRVLVCVHSSALYVHFASGMHI